MKTWIDEEITCWEFADIRLKKRFKPFISSMSNGLDRTIPFACGHWAATKAAYRFLDNEQVDEGVILGGHFEATKARFDGTSSPILVTKDTTEFSFHRNRADLQPPQQAQRLSDNGSQDTARETVQFGRQLGFDQRQSRVH